MCVSFCSMREWRVIEVALLGFHDLAEWWDLPTLQECALTAARGAKTYETESLALRIAFWPV